MPDKLTIAYAKEIIFRIETLEHFLKYLKASKYSDFRLIITATFLGHEMSTTTQEKELVKLNLGSKEDDEYLLNCVEKRIAELKASIEK
jgi:hypothetical protein